MKATGIVRKVDELGRIVVPKELRRTLRITEGDPLEIYTDGESVILKKYERGCTLCGQIEDLEEVNNISLCPNCINKIAKLAK